jgi:hypothetical protein
MADAIRKRYYYKIYSPNLAYLTTWKGEVISDPQFRQVLNGGAGELKINLARKYDNFGEGTDVALQNRVELWVADADNTSNDTATNTMWDSGRWDVDLWDNPIKSFIKLYSGYISAYAPLLDDENQYIEITVLGYVVEASYRVLKDGSGNTTVTYTGQDPGAILKDIIDKYRADGGTNISYLGSSVALTNTTATYTFNNNTLAECFDIIVSLCPYGYYWYIDATGVIYLQQASLGAASHSLTIGKDISYLQTTKRIENLTNRVLLIGGGNPNLFLRYDRASSQTTYGIFERKINNGQVTDTTTADYIAKAILDQNDTPETRTVIHVADNNGENSKIGADIESFRIGDTIQIKNINYGTKSNTMWDIGIWDTDVWDYTLASTTGAILVIVSIQYYPDYIEIEAASRLPEVTKRIESINTSLSIVAQQNLPTVPTTRSV